MSNEYKDWLADTSKEELAQMFHKSQLENKQLVEALEAIINEKKPCIGSCVECSIMDDNLNCYPNDIISIAQQALNNRKEKK